MFTNLKKYFSEAYKRIKSDSPAFFKSLMWTANTVNAIALAMLAADGMYNVFSPKMTHTLQYIVCICAGVAVTSKLTRKDPPSPSDSSSANNVTPPSIPQNH